MDYILKNKKSWNERVPYHLQSDFYNMKDFLKNKSSLQSIELGLLGNVNNKTILHLQCHFGQDSISLAKMGAYVTGVDFSEAAIEAARKLSTDTYCTAEFICCNIYDLGNHLDKSFDIVFTSYGTIGWLPDLNKWAYIISKYLKAGGSFIFAEFHPVVWMFNDSFKKITYNYFNEGEIIEPYSGTYADLKAPISGETTTWNHSISEVINNLIQYDLEIDVFNEYDYSPYNCFKNTIETEKGKFRIKHLDNKIPMVFALKATKKSNKKINARGI